MPTTTLSRRLKTATTKTKPATKPPSATTPKSATSPPLGEEVRHKWFPVRRLREQVNLTVTVERVGPTGFFSEVTKDGSTERFFSRSGQGVFANTFKGSSRFRCTVDKIDEPQGTVRNVYVIVDRQIS